MTTDNNGLTEPPNDQAAHVAKISEIRVDPDTVVEHFSKNLRNKDAFYAQKSFQIRGVLSEGPSTIDVGVDPRTEGAWYPDSPHPVYVTPSTFVHGWSHDERRVESEAADVGLPNESENKRILRQDGFEEGTRAFEEAHRTGMQDWKVMWDKAVRSDLKDEITFRFRYRGTDIESFGHTVPVTYVSDDE
jgi:hypothetical protein